MDIIDLGLTPYDEALELQMRYFDALVEHRKYGGESSPPEALITVQHPPVYTLGRRANPGNVLHRLPGVEVVNISRGGDVTYHGPGQLVVYPILDLERHKLGVKEYIDLLEESVIRTLRHYDIEGMRVGGATGVWLDKDTPYERKICAIGVKCSRYCSMHGLALNVNTDLSYFKHINPCGFVDKGVTSMHIETGFELNFEQVRTRMKKELLSLLR